MLDFLGKANTSIHGLGENDTGKIEVDLDPLRTLTL